MIPISLIIGLVFAGFTALLVYVCIKLPTWLGVKTKEKDEHEDEDADPDKKAKDAKKKDASHGDSHGHGGDGWWKSPVKVVVVVLLGTFIIVAGVQCEREHSVKTQFTLERIYERARQEARPECYIWAFRWCPKVVGMSPDDSILYYETRVSSFATDERGLALVKFWYKSDSTDKNVTYTWYRNGEKSWQNGGSESRRMEINPGSNEDHISGTWWDMDQRGIIVPFEFSLKKVRFVGNVSGVVN